jgi:acyl-coenzyme A synthetase/AMP-(fatty) acid ligase
LTTAAHLSAIAAHHPRTLAVHDDDGPVDHGQFHHRLQRCAQLLAAEGVRPGDRVAVGGPGIARQLLVLLAVEGLGGVTAGFAAEGDDAAPAMFRHVQWVVASLPQAVPAGVRFLLVDDAFLARLDQPLEGPAPAWAEVAGDAPIRMARTSGSTGAPKFLLHTRTGHDWWIDSILEPGQVQGSGSRVLLLCPLLVGGALARASACLRRGGAVLGGRQLDLDQLRPSVVLGLQVQLEGFLDALPPGMQFARPVATVVIGGAVPSVLRERLGAVLRGPVENFYGSNECGRVADHSSGRGEGPLVPGVEVRILDDDGRDLPTGELGTIALRTPVVGRGYLNDEGASAAYRDGWFITSDLGMLVAPGVLRVVGRRDDLLVIGGLKIVASVLDERLVGLPGVADGAVLSVQLDSGRSMLGVAVVLSPGGTLSHAQQELARVMADVAGLGIRLVAVDALPRLLGGKLDRAALLRQFLARVSRRP